MGTSKDPVRWRLEASNDTLAWNTVDAHVQADYLTPIGRQMPVGFFVVGCAGAAVQTADDGFDASPLLLSGLILLGMILCATLLCACIFCYRVVSHRKILAAHRQNLRSQHFRKVINEEERHQLQPVKTPDSPNNAEGATQSHDEIGASEAETRRAPGANKDDVLKPESVVVVARQGTPESTSRRSSASSSKRRPSFTSLDDQLPEGEQSAAFFQPGTEVAIIGLAPRPENGAVCEVLEYEVGSRKYMVRVLSTNQTVALDPENVIHSFCKGMLDDLG